MCGRALRLALLATCLPLLVPLAGCFLATDLINPGVLSAVGLDPETVIAPEGRLLIAFRNLTQYPMASITADYTGQSVTTATNADVDTVLATDLAANETRTMVLDCPVTFVNPGTALLIVDGAGVDLTYAGSPLLAGSGYVCGDVIEISVVQIGDGTGAAVFTIQVQILAGR